ncbi:MAG TPA: hypothetical protein VFG28_15815 [Syntrophales bacterium]|nr:hypothetical protein [Syntrophales bacterium]
MRERKLYWILGSMTSFSGVALVRLLAPRLSEGSYTAVALIGYALSFFGIFIIARAVRKNQLKIQRP